ncbi:hypothetical protein OJAV_G00065220 [Oryzias javanicus]|uniref:Uncharacterized protein n=1 Tax=Oryzias javanicus TaxID=123683 RepID=A0A3S2PV44_ORYJA|nr:hypothetical protein OJAV_G00065220 [Oryzias javanicus]
MEGTVQRWSEERKHQQREEGRNQFHRKEEERAQVDKEEREGRKGAGSCQRRGGSPLETGDVQQGVDLKTDQQRMKGSQHL